MCTAQETAGIAQELQVSSTNVRASRRLPPPPARLLLTMSMLASRRTLCRASRAVGRQQRAASVCSPARRPPHHRMLGCRCCPRNGAQRKTGWHKAPVVMPRLACDSCRAQWVPMMNTDLQETDEAIFDIVEHEKTRQ